MHNFKAEAVLGLQSGMLGKALTKTELLVDGSSRSKSCSVAELDLSRNLLCRGDQTEAKALSRRQTDLEWLVSWAEDEARAKIPPDPKKIKALADLDRRLPRWRGTGGTRTAAPTSARPSRGS